MVRWRGVFFWCVWLDPFEVGREYLSFVVVFFVIIFLGGKLEVLAFKERVTSFWTFDGLFGQLRSCNEGGCIEKTVMLCIFSSVMKEMIKAFLFTRGGFFAYFFWGVGLLATYDLDNT